MDAYVDDNTLWNLNKAGITSLSSFKNLVGCYKTQAKSSKICIPSRIQKLICFMISKKWIEVDSSIAKTIIDTPLPRALKGFFQSIRRFISNITMKYEPFNKLIRKDAKFVWEPKCQATFEWIKRYPSNLEATSACKTSTSIHFTQWINLWWIFG